MRLSNTCIKTFKTDVDSYIIHSLKFGFVFHYSFIFNKIINLFNFSKYVFLSQRIYLRALLYIYIRWLFRLKYLWFWCIMYWFLPVYGPVRIRTFLKSPLTYRPLFISEKKHWYLNISFESRKPAYYVWNNRYNFFNIKMKKSEVDVTIQQYM